MDYSKVSSIFQKLNFHLCLLLVFCIPFGNKIIPPLIAVWGIAWIFEGNFRQRFNDVYYYRFPFFLITSFYIWHIIGLFYSENMDDALFEIEVKFSFLLFPILFIGVNSLYRINRVKLFKVFILGNAAAGIFCIIKSLYFIYIHYGFGSAEVFRIYMFYTRVSVFLHPSYFAMYIVFSLVLIEYLFFNKHIKSRNFKIMYLFIAALFIFLIYLLSSRAGVISLFIICTAYLFYYFFRIKKIGTRVLVSFLLIILALLMLYNSRFNLLFQNKYVSNSNKNEIKVESANTGPSQPDVSSNVRLKIWNSAWIIFLQNPLLGLGTGDIKIELTSEYIRSNNEVALNSNLNVHNQYLETLTELGIIGLMLLISLIFFALWKSYTTKNSLLLVFILIIAFNFLFETMLNTQAGVVFICFFYCFLIFVKKNPETTIS